MRITVLLVISFIAFAAALRSEASALVDPALKQQFGLGAQQLRVVVLMSKPAQEPTRPLRYDRRGVMNFLKARASSSWDLIRRSLTDADRRNIHVRSVFWINNTFAAEVSRRGLEILGQTPGVDKILTNVPIEQLDPIEVSRGEVPSQNPLPYDVAESGLEELIKELPNVTGKGVTIGVLDTGVDAKHPALEGKIAKFYDATERRERTPVDFGYHGTHTSGTMVGGNRGSLIFGMAPEAQLIASTGVDTRAALEDLIAAMQWLLENPPRAINNSWRYRNDSKYMEPIYSAVSAWEAAGILPVFAAGNEGPRKKTIGYPSNHPQAITIGATQQGGSVAKFSSRGPVLYKGEIQNKPDITAPGNKVNSSVPGGGYDVASGTSMAAPHVTGAAALVLQVNPTLTPRQIKELLIATATPVDENGRPCPAGVWNLNYGFGRLNVFAAVKKAVELAQSRLSFIPTLFSTLTAGPGQAFDSGSNETIEAAEL